MQVDALVCLGEAARRGHLLSLDPVIAGAPDASWESWSLLLVLVLILILVLGPDLTPCGPGPWC